MDSPTLDIFKIQPDTVLGHQVQVMPCLERLEQMIPGVLSNLVFCDSMVSVCQPSQFTQIQLHPAKLRNRGTRSLCVLLKRLVATVTQEGDSNLAEGQALTPSECKRDTLHQCLRVVFQFLICKASTCSQTGRLRLHRSTRAHGWFGAAQSSSGITMTALKKNLLKN